MKKGFWRNKEKEWGITKENSVDFLLLDREDKNKKIKFIKLFLDFIFLLLFPLPSVKKADRSFGNSIERSIVSLPFSLSTPF